MTLEEYRKQKKSVQRNPNAKTATQPADNKKVKYRTFTSQSYFRIPFFRHKQVRKSAKRRGAQLELRLLTLLLHHWSNAVQEVTDEDQEKGADVTDNHVKMHPR